MVHKHGLSLSLKTIPFSIQKELEIFIMRVLPKSCLRSYKRRKNMTLNSTLFNLRTGTISWATTLKLLMTVIFTRNMTTRRITSASIMFKKPIHLDKSFGKRRPKLASDMPSPLMVQWFTSSLSTIRVPSWMSREIRF